MDVQLILENSRQQGRATRLAKGIYLVGRSKVCQIRPKNLYVSRRHCAFIHRRHELLIQDLGSTSGTWVNDERIEPSLTVVLKNGDKVRVGQTRFLVQIDDAQHGAAVNSQTPSDSSVDADASFPASTLSSGECELQDDDLLPEIDEAANDGDGNQPRDGAIDAAVSPRVETDRGLPTRSDERPQSMSLAQQEDLAEEAEDTYQTVNNIADVLAMLEQEEDDSADDAPNGTSRRFELSDNSELELDGNADVGNVEFVSPKSGESLDVTQPVPSYAMRQDWDVKGVYAWVNNKEVLARERARRAKRQQNPSQLNSEAEAVATVSNLSEAAVTRPTPELPPRFQRPVAQTQKNGDWIDWLESDHVKPVFLTTLGLLFSVWIIWNIWQLITYRA